MTATQNPVDPGLIARIVAEYREMPGLALTLDQAQRLWGCDAVTCRLVVDVLIARGDFRWSRNGRLLAGNR